MLREVATEYGTTPLEYLLCIMRDENQTDEIRLFAAKAALPYCTPRLAAVRIADNDIGGEMSHEQWVRRLAGEIMEPDA